MALDGGMEAEQYADLIKDFFGSFVVGPGGASRPDPGDVGAQYRSVLGLPGGKASPLWPLVLKHNNHNMTLTWGKGGDDDSFNAVFVCELDLHSVASPMYYLPMYYL